MPDQEQSSQESLHKPRIADPPGQRSADRSFRNTRQKQKLGALAVVPAEAGRTRRWKERRLEIRLRDRVPQEFITTLEAQRKLARTVRGSKTKAPCPVSYDEHAIRIMWIGPHAAIWPTIDRTLAIFGRIVPIHEKTVVDARQHKPFTDSQFEDHILELCQAGNRMAAIRLLRKRRNYSLRDAKRFVDELIG